MVGASAASYINAYNYLVDHQKKAEKEELAACNGSVACVGGVELKYALIGLVRLTFLGEELVIFVRDGK
ncbi:hypothetical protein [Entomobacter blattae]|uniref:hypothetical protein n=1 Tax=Entomobacter blattae TaxID=2762277 RepID=UPI00193B95B3|nr:hypothetical protein [Entomobacter blattae]